MYIYLHICLYMYKCKYNTNVNLCITIFCGTNGGVTSASTKTPTPDL